MPNGATQSDQDGTTASTDERSATVTFSDLARAAYCPRQLYYARQAQDRTIPERQRSRIDLAFRYAATVDASDTELAQQPIDCTPRQYRRRLRSLCDGDLEERFTVSWNELVDPTRARCVLTGRHCRGVVHKVLAGRADDDPPTPTIVSPGTPPENGVWQPQTVRAVAAAKALAWETQREIPRTLVEYPAVGVVREVTQTVRTKAHYRRALRTTRGIDGPPPRVNDSRCDTCSFRAKCGTKTRSLRTRLGL